MGTLDLLKKVIQKINSVYTSEEYHKFIDQSNRDGKFSVTT
jgi:hypothetical protein